MKIIEKIHNTINNEITKIERDATEVEIAEYELTIARVQQEKEQEEIINSQKAALLAKLGITKEEAKLLLA